MTDTNFTQNDLSIETLFNNGVCLTYNPYLPNDAFRYIRDKEREYRQKNHVKNVLIKSKAELGCRGFLSNFHYFSNGILIHNFDESKEKDKKLLKKVLKLLEIRNLPVLKIYALLKIVDYCTAYDLMRKIAEHANLVYSYKEDLRIVDLPKLEDFVRECFANGNILLTAHKGEKVYPQLRELVALFADGRYYKSEEVRNPVARYNGRTALMFERFNSDNFIFFNEDYVPKEYIAALYEEAQKHDWFITSEDMARKFVLSDAETQDMNRYVESLFQTRKCLSVTDFEDRTVRFSADPDLDRYALFSDGLLVFGGNHPNPEESYFYKQMSLVYKDMKLKVEKVPEYYIPAIYKALPKYQRGAKDIYMEMVKEMAKKIKSKLSIPHYQALDLAAKINGWDDFKSIKIEDEIQARGLIRNARWRKNMDIGLLIENYNRFL